MSLTLKCPYCGSCGKVPERFLGTRIRCLICEGKFRCIEHHITIEYPEKPAQANPGEIDKIALFGCRTCNFLGFIPGSYKSSTIRCPACDHLSSLEKLDDAGNGPEAAAGPSSTRERAGPGTAPPPLPQADWYYSREGRKHGPIPLVALKTLAETAQLAPIDLVWKAGMPEWQTAATAGFFPRGAPPLPRSVATILPLSSLSLGLN